MDYNKQWRKDNKKHIQEYNRQYREENPVRCRECQRQWRKKNPDYDKQWAKDNPDKVNAKIAKRKARELNQTPQNANKELINFYYEVAATMLDYEVDHIKPLSKGGLHHEDNLQILEKSLNRQKSNKWPLTKEDQIKFREGIRLWL